MKRFFHSEQNEFRNKLILMGQKAVENVGKACQALRENDPELAQTVIEADERINELELQIDAEAIRYISLRSPVATELRLFMLGTKVGNDLERVGDEATGIARRVIRLCRDTRPDMTLEFPEMMEEAQSMMSEAIRCFLEEDVVSAREIVRKDRIVDEYYHHIHHRVSRYMMRHPEEISAGMDLIFIAKALERVADHAANLAEEVIYLYEGHDVRHSAEIHALRGTA